MDVRPATEADIETLKELWLAFDREHPTPEYEDVDEAVELSEVEEYVREHIALLAENGEVAAGFVLARMRGGRHGWISDLYVSPDLRRGGAARRLVRDAAAALRGRGAEVIELDVRPWNEEARTVYERWGFRESKLTLATKADELETRLSQDAPAPSHGLVFAQTDDEARVTKAVRAYVPRLGRSGRTDIHPPANGWIAVDDELCSSDPALLRRLAQELSYRTGGVVVTLGVEEEAVVRYVLFDRGSVADEYCSLPEYHGPLPPGDVVALSANPTVAHRLTGADPERVRAVAKTASTAADLPPADEPVRGARRRAGSAAAVITLYDADRCPYCARVRIVLAEKSVPYETVVVDLADRPAWLYEKNPLGKVPVLEEDGLCIPESAVIMELLEERFPEPPLYPVGSGPAGARPARRLALRRRVLARLLRRAARLPRRASCSGWRN